MRSWLRNNRLIFRSIIYLNGIKNILLFRLLQTIRPIDLGSIVIVTGEPRSGTTWIMELIRDSDRFITVFEPLHVRKGAMRGLNLGWRPFVNSKSEEKRFVKSFFRMIKGLDMTVWSFSYNRWQDVLRGRRLLIKFVRVGFMLPILVKNVDSRTKIVHIIRHPVSVAKSRLSNFGGNGVNLSFLSESIDTSNLEFYKSLQSDVAKMVVLWCISTNDIFQLCFSNRNITVVYYEDLLINPSSNFETLMNWLNIKWDRMNYISKTSKSDFLQQFKEDKSEQLNKWITETSNLELDEVQKVLDYFKIDIYSAHKPLPRIVI